MIIAGFTGVGKTLGVKMHPEGAIDFDSTAYKYVVENSPKANKTQKAKLRRDIHPEWPFNYVDAIEEIIDDYKYLVIPSDIAVLSLLKERRIPFIVARPFREIEDEYRRRLTERGDREDLIDALIYNWESHFDSLERVGSCAQILLDIDEYLSDVIKDFDEIAVGMVFTGLEMLIASGGIEVIKEDGATRIEIKTDKLGCEEDE
jgi:hypothetical protein